MVCFGFTSCKKQAPQVPSNKVVIDNSDTKALLEINQHLAKCEDSLVEVFAHKKDKAFIKNELGFWYKIDKPGKGEKITNKSACTLIFQVRLLNGKMVEKGKKQIVIGKKQIVLGLEEGLKLLNHGDSASFIIPWYLGYGMNGHKPKIAAYTSIIYEIKVENE